MIVLDANILIRAILGRRVRHLLETYAGQGVRFYAPDVAYADAEEYLPALLTDLGKPVDELAGALLYLKLLVKPIDDESYGICEDAARERLSGRDEEDWPVLASALCLGCAIWTEDTDFFGTGVPVWTSSRIEIFLKAQIEPPKAEEG